MFLSVQFLGRGIIMFTPETYSDYTIFNDEMNNLIESARPFEFSDYGAAEVYADEIDDAIREMLGGIDSSNCGADEETLTALRDRLDEFADDLGRADDICDNMDISIVYDYDALDFYQENESACEDALENYYGGPSGTDCNTAMGVIVAAANCGLDSIVRSAAYEWTQNLETEVRAMVDDIDEMIDQMSD